MTRFVTIVVLALACLAPALWAHANLDKAEPKVGSTVTTAPTEVKIYFTDDPQVDKSEIQVFDAKDNQIDKKDTHADKSDHPNKSVLIVSLPALAPGTYKVKWHAVCPANHKTEGSFEFTVAAK